MNKKQQQLSYEEILENWKSANSYTKLSDIILFSFSAFIMIMSFVMMILSSTYFILPAIISQITTGMVYFSERKNIYNIENEIYKENTSYNKYAVIRDGIMVVAGIVFDAFMVMLC